MMGSNYVFQQNWHGNNKQSFKQELEIKRNEPTKIHSPLTNWKGNQLACSKLLLGSKFKNISGKFN